MCGKTVCLRRANTNIRSFVLFENFIAAWKPTRNEKKKWKLFARVQVSDKNKKKYDIIVPYIGIEEVCCSDALSDGVKTKTNKNGDRIGKNWRRDETGDELNVAKDDKFQ